MREIYRRGRAGAKRAGEILRATLREIFDEAAYDRFLQRHALTSSHEAYNKFVRESAARGERRPRCC